MSSRAQIYVFENSGNLNCQADVIRNPVKSSAHNFNQTFLVTEPWSLYHHSRRTDWPILQIASMIGSCKPDIHEMDKTLWIFIKAIWENLEQSFIYCLKNRSEAPVIFRHNHQLSINASKAGSALHNPLMHERTKRV